jgi:hypothetical protein
VHADPTILAQGICQLERVELNIRIAMCESFDHGGHYIFATTLTRRYPVADIEDVLPVLGGQVFVGRFGLMCEEATVSMLPDSSQAGQAGSCEELTDNVVEYILLGPKHDGRGSEGEIRSQ